MFSTLKRRTPLRRSRIKSSADVAQKTALRRRLRTPKRKKVTKKKVWAEFSKFIRTRGADENGFNVCVTCNERYFWKDLQAGHFIRGRLNANLFEERGCWPQCYSCNIGRQGHVVIYYKVMLAKYGQEVIDELLAQNNQTRKWKAGELQELLDRYKSLNASNPLLQDR